jgi:hypothetical protein
MASQKEREVKLQGKYRQGAYGSKIIPELKLSGVWLESVGFKAGSRVSIIIEENQLIIKPVL